MTFHGIDKHRDQCRQALTTDTVSGLPQYLERLPHGFIVKAVAHSSRFDANGPHAQHADGMLSGVARQIFKFLDDLDPVAERPTAISCSQCLGQFFACGHADSRLHVMLLLPANPMGSNLREATGQHG